MTAKRVISLIVGILAAIAGLYLLLVLSVLVFIGYREPPAPNLGTAVFALLPACLGLVCMYESYRFFRFFFKNR
jgi:hypothetical protein